MAYTRVLEKFVDAYTADPGILCERGKETETFGSDAHYLNDILDLTKNDLIRLERLGYAIKARYVTKNKRHPDIDGPHRVRWLLFKESNRG